jgi:hypothetical protein
LATVILLLLRLSVGLFGLCDDLVNFAVKLSK